MTVAERIACMQDFTKQMVARREQIVTLIMWEIDSNSRSLIVEGIPAQVGWSS